MHTHSHSNKNSFGKISWKLKTFYSESAFDSKSCIILGIFWFCSCLSEIDSNHTYYLHYSFWRMCVYVYTLDEYISKFNR